MIFSLRITLVIEWILAEPERGVWAIAHKQKQNGNPKVTVFNICPNVMPGQQSATRHGIVLAI
ncbi:hypothetical protein [Lelliottia sp. CFBP8978]|jgi:hypothetical protein|uniref:hypothetical protein n=1 Tax=Lelliottia sp. CFBP8978 TaxID=3096522 RepID=UPI002A6ADE53|nr:hypothetical protein [Lelliottia sp. CFBP8978]